MTQVSASQFNPNHFLGCHPIGSLSFLDEIDNPILLSRFTPESILNGIITWKQERSLRRKALDSALEKIAGHDVPGKQYAKTYLHHMYRRNCKPNTLRSACTAVLLFLMYLKCR